MKFEIEANLDFSKDIIELDDDLTEQEIEKELFEYIISFLDWNYERTE